MFSKHTDTNCLKYDPNQPEKLSVSPIRHCSYSPSFTQGSGCFSARMATAAVQARRQDLKFCGVVGLRLDSLGWLPDEWTLSGKGEATTIRSSSVCAGNEVGAALARVVAAADVEGLTGCFVIVGARGLARGSPVVHGEERLLFSHENMIGSERIK